MVTTISQAYPLQSPRQRPGPSRPATLQGGAALEDQLRYAAGEHRARDLATKPKSNRREAKVAFLLVAKVAFPSLVGRFPKVAFPSSPKRNLDLGLQLGRMPIWASCLLVLALPAHKNCHLPHIPEGHRKKRRSKLFTSGRSPFIAGRPQAILHSHLHSTIRPPGDVHPFAPT